jgi:hypothetical protein
MVRGFVYPWFTISSLKCGYTEADSTVSKAFIAKDAIELKR